MATSVNPIEAPAESPWGRRHVLDMVSYLDLRAGDLIINEDHLVRLDDRPIAHTDRPGDEHVSISYRRVAPDGSTSGLRWSSTTAMANLAIRVTPVAE